MFRYVSYKRDWLKVENKLKTMTDAKEEETNKKETTKDMVA
jgi:hypothetical protein